MKGREPDKEVNILFLYFGLIKIPLEIKIFRYTVTNYQEIIFVYYKYKNKYIYVCLYVFRRWNKVLPKLRWNFFMYDNILFLKQTKTRTKDP